jgi:S-adenosylmethionine hydrolase
MKKRIAVISLLTDFGLTDWFAGTMKGVIVGICPQARIIDLTHDVKPGDIRAAAFALARGCGFFPSGTIHVAVVDPGVGSSRPAIVVRTADFWFIGPDNGVLSLALQREQIESIHRLENAGYFLPQVSHTFHGRDVFAPVAAHVGNGVPLHQFGPACDDYEKLDWREPREARDGWRGEVVYVDCFGNAITNLDNSLFATKSHDWSLRLKSEKHCPVRPYYEAVPAGRAVAVPGSSGLLEIAVNGGNASRRFGLKVGAKVDLVRSRRRETQGVFSR